MSKKTITRFLRYARQAGANDLVIDSRPQHISLDCYLPNGEKRSLTLPKKLEVEFFASLRKILAFAPGEILTREYRKMPTRTGEINFYLTVLPGDRQEKIIINLINEPAEVWRLKQIGLTPASRQSVEQSLKWRSGLIIVASAPQSGKSATLYSLLMALDNESRSTYLLAKQPLYTVPGINILKPTPANWRAVTRHDSDYIFADDVQEDWALVQAVKAATSGRLVACALTASGEKEVLKRLANLDLPEKLSAAGRIMIISQRLIKLTRPAGKRRLQDRKIIGSFEILKLPR